MSPPRLYCIPHLRRTALPALPCDCIAAGNTEKPKQHGADPHAKNCASYELHTTVQVIRQDYEPSPHKALRKAIQQTHNGYISWVERNGVPATAGHVEYGNRGMRK